MILKYKGDLVNTWPLLKLKIKIYLENWLKICQNILNSHK